MTSKEIRQSFLDFFQARGHEIVPSAPVIPHGDKTILFTNAGMNQFKDVFLGEGSRSYTRAADTQKVIRVSGKHNDLEEVGHDTYHHTFFEMLGNWSFGDYGKKEAIEWAWELLTSESYWKLDKSRLYATVYETDDESYELWKAVTDIDHSHILRFGAKDNFWEMGETGPCGPCSEIHYDHTPDKSGGKLVNAGVPEVIEIWNLVFIQYDRMQPDIFLDVWRRHDITGIWEFNPKTRVSVLQEAILRSVSESAAVAEGIHKDTRTVLNLPNGDSFFITEDFNSVSAKYAKALVDYSRGLLKKLPMMHVDTGMGFERICAVIQGKHSNYETDIFSPYLDWIKQKVSLRHMPIANEIQDAEDSHSLDNPYLIAARVIADHVRTLSTAIADGALPGNDGRGYVLRRILRRAARYGRKIGFTEPFLFELAQVVREQLGDVFPELHEHIKLIRRVLQAEEESFNKTLDRGLELFYNLSSQAKETESPWIDGEDAFKLYDTFGFPIDLTQVLAKEEGLEVDMHKFEKLLKEQKERSRADRAGKRFNVNINENITISDEARAETTKFVGYPDYEIEIKENLELPGANFIALSENRLFVDATPFYAESGGQVGDTGFIFLQGLTVGRRYRVTDVQKSGTLFEHIIDIGQFSPEGSIIEVKDLVVDRPRRIDIMRNHSATHLMHSALRKVLGEHVYQAGSLVTENHLRFDFNHFQKVTPDELREIEAIVNEKIRESITLIHHRNIPFEEAKKMGALMFFGDKYGARVNVVDFGPFSREFCGGTHIANTAEIGLFKFTSESSIASGVRRIEAVTGRGVENWLLEEEKQYSELSREHETLLAEKQKLEKELTKLRLESRREEMRKLAKTAKPIGVPSVLLVVAEIKARDAAELQSLGEMLREEMKNGAVAVLGAKLAEDKVSLVATVSDDLLKEKGLKAGNLIGKIAEIVGGRGGGRPGLAQAGGKFPEKLTEALAKVEEIVRENLK